MRPLTGKTWSDNAIDKLYELTEEVLCEVRCFIVVYNYYRQERDREVERERERVAFKVEQLAKHVQNF